MSKVDPQPLQVTTGETWQQSSYCREGFEQQHSTARKVASLIGGFAAMLACGSVYGWGVVSLYLKKYYDYTPDECNIIGSIQVFAVYITFHTALFFDVYGARPTLCLGGVFIITGWLLTMWGVLNHQPAVVIGLYQGLCGQGVQPLMLSAMDNIRNFGIERRGICSGIIFTGFGLTSVIMAQLQIHAFPDNMPGFLITMAVACAFLVGYQILVFAAPPEVAATAQPSGMRRMHLRSLLCNTDAHLFLTCIFFFGMSLYYWIVNIGRLSAVTDNPVKVGTLITEFGVCNILARPIVGILSDALPFTRSQFMAFGSLLVSVTMFAVSFKMIVASAFLNGIADGWMFAIWPALTREVHGNKHFGVTFSLYLLIFGFGDIVINFVLGKLFLKPTAEVGGVIFAAAVCGVGNLIGAVVALVLGSRLRNSGPG